MKIAVTTMGITVKNNVIFGMGIFHTAIGLKVLRQAKINVRQMSRGDSFGRVIFKILCDNGAKTQPRQNTGQVTMSVCILQNLEKDRVYGPIFQLLVEK